MERLLKLKKAIHKNLKIIKLITPIIKFYYKVNKDASVKHQLTFKGSKNNSKDIY